MVRMPPCDDFVNLGVLFLFANQRNYFPACDSDRPNNCVQGMYPLYNDKYIG
eukprot:m.251266 g.251266  ORF g.251266 m.251266 type:complete len:52 (-) comp16147_c0_seq4:318-473(-)